MKGLLFVLLATFVVYVQSADNPLTPKCPIPDEPDYVPMLRHPCNCGTYFVCLTEPPIPMTCPDGLQFDEVKQVCDFAWRVRCKPRNDCDRTDN